MRNVVVFEWPTYMAHLEIALKDKRPDFSGPLKVWRADDFHIMPYNPHDYKIFLFLKNKIPPLKFG